MPGEEDLSNMDTNTKKNSIETLKKLRDVYQCQLNASVIAEIEVVIAALEDGCDCSKDNSSDGWKMRVLVLIVDVVRLVTNVTDLMK